MRLRGIEFGSKLGIRQLNVFPPKQLDQVELDLISKIFGVFKSFGCSSPFSSFTCKEIVSTLISHTEKNEEGEVEWSSFW